MTIEMANVCKTCWGKKRIEMEAIGTKTRSGSSNSQKCIVKSECIHKKIMSLAAFHLLNGERANILHWHSACTIPSPYWSHGNTNATYLSLCCISCSCCCRYCLFQTHSVLINSTIYTSKLEYFMVDVFRLCHCQCDAISEMLKFVCWAMDTLYAIRAIRVLS